MKRDNTNEVINLDPKVVEELKKDEIDKQEILKSIEQIKKGKVVVKTMEELESMEEE